MIAAAAPTGARQPEIDSAVAFDRSRWLAATIGRARTAPGEPPAGVADRNRGQFELDSERFTHEVERDSQSMHYVDVLDIALRFGARPPVWHEDDPRILTWIDKVQALPTAQQQGTLARALREADEAAGSDS